jgi:hypothetical protein
LLLSGKVYGALAQSASRLYACAGSQLKILVQNCKKRMTLEQLIACTEGVEVKIVVEAEKAAEKIGGAFSKTIVAEEAVGLFSEQFSFLDKSIGNLAKLEKAAEAIKDIPGAMEGLNGAGEGVLAKLFNCGKKGNGPGKLATARGAAYEIEKAYDLMQRGEKVIEMGKRCGSREFDIITNTKYIECKNIDWSTIPRTKITDMKSTFGQQAQVAKQQGKIFEIYSKQPISQYWKGWFAEKQIKVVEG